MGTGRTFVIGDLHGCVEELKTMLDAIAPDSGDHVCFLGDYVDRGPSSKEVVDRLLRLREEGPRCTFLKGNHEDMFLSYLGLPGLYGEVFLANGGGHTLRSYGVEGIDGHTAVDQLPPEHREFFVTLDNEARFGDFLCVHAGLRPSVPLEKQTDEDRFWIREEFISARHAFPFTVLFGHTPQTEVLVNLPYKLGLDTGLVYGNKLSCFELGSKEIFQVRRGSRSVTRESLEREFARARHLT